MSSFDYKAAIKDRPEYACQVEALLGPSFNGVVTAEQVQDILNSVPGLTQEKLMLTFSKYAATFARSPISKFMVGAVACGLSGNLYFGANIEIVGQALSMSVHGEQCATANAISHGETGLTSLAVNAAPCGYCRQFLYEISTAETLNVILSDKDSLLIDLLPDPFGPKDLGITSALMESQDNKLTLSDTPDDVAAVAFAAANSCYAPYSFDYSGVAFQTCDGAIYSGSYAENAAYNPSMSPMQAALATFIWSRKSYDEITSAYLVEVQSSKASQIDTTANVLTSITDIKLGVLFAEVDS